MEEKKFLFFEASALQDFIIASYNMLMGTCTYIHASQKLDLSNELAYCHFDATIFEPRQHSLKNSLFAILI